MRFVTLFPQGENIHLIKDVGQIPYCLHKYHGVEASLVSDNIYMDGPYIDETQGIKFSMTGSKKCDWRIASCLYLLLNAKRIDWLNIYHFGKKSLIWAKIYKFVNPKGKVYLKLDIDLNKCDEIDRDNKTRESFQKCVAFMDIVSAETTTVIDRIQKYTSHKIELIPNGFVMEENYSSVPKENIFLTVGRLGTRQKATEILLEAYAKCANEMNWNLELAGAIEEDFHSYIQDFFEEYPGLKSRVKFWGLINDRKELTELYSRAKVLVMPSRWESFGLVLPEAASQGCKLLLTSSIASSADFVVNEHFGRVIEPDNVSQLMEAMQEMAHSGVSVEEEHLIRENALSRFSWKNITEKLYKCMLEKENCNDE